VVTYQSTSLPDSSDKNGWAAGRKNRRKAVFAFLGVERLAHAFDLAAGQVNPATADADLVFIVRGVERRAKGSRARRAKRIPTAPRSLAS
jgi:hypothetical protein